MDIITQFMTYAGDFEKTFVDDDWSRLRQYFTDDAVYEVKGSTIGCKLEGPDAIFKGIKKSLDGFDRKFDERDIDVTDGPHVDGDTMRVGWTVAYKKSGLEPFLLRGRSEVRYRDGKIAYLGDFYDAAMENEIAAWQQSQGMKFDPSYV